MNLKSLAKIVLFLLALASFAPNTPAQQNNGNQTAEITKEGDHLPFMKNDKAAESAAQEPSTSGMLVKTLGAMLLIVGLIFFGAWGLKKVGFGTAKQNAQTDTPELSIISSVSLGSGRTISTVRFGERVLVVGSTAQAFTLLADQTLNEHISAGGGSPRSVAELLSEESISFESELAMAESKFDFLSETGGRG